MKNKIFINYQSPVNVNVISCNKFTLILSSLSQARTGGAETRSLSRGEEEEEEEKPGSRFSMKIIHCIIFKSEV